jgi:hypothetical protein
VNAAGQMEDYLGLKVVQVSDGISAKVDGHRVWWAPSMHQAQDPRPRFI